MGHQNSSVQKVLKQTVQQRHWLEMAEYASLAGSALGVLAMAISEQAFYAVAPLTLALSLNTANRYRFERDLLLSRDSEVAEVRRSVENLEKNAVKAIVRLRQKLLGEIESLREATSGLSGSDVAESVEMERQLGAIEESAASLQESLASVGQKVLTAQDWEALNGRLLGLEEAIAILQKDLETLPESQDSNVSQLQAKIDYLDRQNKEVVKPHLKRLISIVKQLQKTNSTTSSSQNITSSNPSLKQQTQIPVKQPDRSI